MNTLRQIALLGNPVLAKQADPVTRKELKSAEIQTLIADMLATLKDADGVGIAAPQVYVPKQIIIIASRPNSRYPHAPELAPFAVINPVITELSKQTEMGWEGCLSIPGLRGRVPRSVTVSFSYTTAEGKQTDMSLEGFPARIFQHEHDHLSGIMFPERMQSMKDLVSEKEYYRIIEEES